MPKILLVPDIFFHRWDQSDGELWVCLRPFIEAQNAAPPNRLGNLAEFHEWAKNPHAPATNFTFYKPQGSTGDPCKRTEAAQRLIPINLPSNIDIWIRTINGPSDPAPWTRISRTRGCLTAPSILKNNLAELHGEDKNPPSQRASFSWWFNETVKQKHQDLANNKDEQDQLSAWLELRFESGKGIHWRHEKEISNLYRNEAETLKPALPLFKPNGPWATQFSDSEQLHTNLYWLCGLMFPIGRKPVADGINQITALDIWLVDNSVPIDSVVPEEESVVFKFSIPEFLPIGPEKPYFAQIVDNYSAKLVCALEDPSILLKGTLPTGATNDGPIAYFSPALQAYHKVVTSPFLNAWEALSSHTDREKHTSQGLGKRALIPMPTDRNKLRDLAGFEIRSKTLGVPDVLSVVPGITVSGKVRPYRRFPRIVGKGALLPTVMVFEPSVEGVDLLAKTEEYLGRDGLESLFASAEILGIWRLELLETVALPWDGPNQVYRVVAMPKSGAKQEEDNGARTCDPTSAVLMLQAPLHVSTSNREYLDSEKKISKWLWQPGPPINSIQGLRQDWDQKALTWSKMPINTFFVEGGDKFNAEMDCLFLGTYNFFLANSRLRLEEILGVYANLSDVALANCVPNRTPLQDFEDDLVNYNVASVLSVQGELLDDRVRYAQATDQMVRKLNRQQIIPLVFEWPHAPKNTLENANKKLALSWGDMREYVRYAALEMSRKEPFSIQLEHSYSTVIQATDKFGEPIKLRRSKIYDWSIDFPTSAEGSDFSESTNTTIRFVVCRYDSLSDSVILTFDPRVLDPDLMKELKNADSQSLALRAWRSVAELLRARTVALELELCLFDLGTIVGTSIASAAALAKNGFTGHWRDALRVEKRLQVALPTEERRKLDEWAMTLFKMENPSFPPLELKVPVGIGGSRIGQISHVARASILIIRSAEHTPSEAVRLVPITQQPGLQVVAPNSLWGAWSSIGFDRLNDINGLPDSEKKNIVNAFKNWRATLESGEDSITPAIAQKTLQTSRHSQALISELNGTDWFTPPESPQSPIPLDARAVLLPFGFAPCARDKLFGGLAQQILQRALVVLNDTIDLAYEDWVRSLNTDWPARMKEIASLAVRQSNEWEGPLPGLVQRIVQILLWPEPDPSSGLVADEVSRLASSYIDRHGQIGQLGLAVQRLLMENPALFADAKALLLTRIEFLPSTTQRYSPPEGTLARAQFTRRVRPANSDPTVHHVQAVLGWRNLVAVGMLEDISPTPKLGFLEPLDGARYDNAFDVSIDNQLFESFEGMVDPEAGATDKWGSAAPIVPGRDDNGQSEKAPREVRLASRNIVEPPELLWSGVNDRLATALRNISMEQSYWTLERLMTGNETDPNVTRGDLTVVAYRRAPRQWNEQLTVDQKLVHFIYRVRGDEEATAGKETDSFENDGFFIGGLRNAGSTSAMPQIVSMNTLPEDAEKAMRRLLEVPRGSSEAASFARDVLLKDLTFFDLLQGFVRTEFSAEVQTDMVLLKPERVGDFNGSFCVGGGSDFRTRVRDVCLFRPAFSAGDAKPNSLAFLVVSLALDVWTGWDVTLMQGRNLPFGDWAPECRLPSGRKPAPFNRVFWQSTNQSSRPATQHVSKVASNSYIDWDPDSQPRRIFRIPPQWVGRSVSAKELLDKMLFEERLIVGNSLPEAKTIMHPSAAPFVYSIPFSITVFQEQLAGLKGRTHAVRFPFPSVYFAPGDELKTNVWFPEEYATFSIDVRWLRPSGSVPLALERIFASA